MIDSLSSLSLLHSILELRDATVYEPYIQDDGLRWGSTPAGAIFETPGLPDPGEILFKCRGSKRGVGRTLRADGAGAGDRGLET